MMNIQLEIPESFYEGEERCGYYVSPKMKKVWAVQLDLIAEFARVCEKYNLKYCVAYGTLLGAVRHNGFIPWDDDVDFFMERRYYEKLCEIAKKELKYPYYLCSPHNNHDKLMSYAKLHNEDTTMLEEDSIRLLKNGKKFFYSQSIFIDIWVLDDMADNDREFMKIFIKAMFFKKMAYSIYGLYNYKTSPHLWKRPLKAFFHYAVKLLHIPTPYYKFFEKFLETITLLNFPYSKKLVDLACTSLNKKSLDKYSMLRSDLHDTIYLPFEVLSLPAPSKYEKLLDKWYGNWHEYDIVPKHGVFIDTERSYKYYTEEGHPFEVK